MKYRQILMINCILLLCIFVPGCNRYQQPNISSPQTEIQATSVLTPLPTRESTSSSSESGENRLATLPILSINQSPSEYISSELSLLPLGDSLEQFELSLSAHSIEKAPNSRISLELPSDVEMIEGKINWVKDLGPNQSFESSVSIFFKGSGPWLITGRVLHEVEDGNSWGALSELYIDQSDLVRFTAD